MYIYIYKNAATKYVLQVVRLSALREDLRRVGGRFTVGLVKIIMRARSLPDLHFSRPLPILKHLTLILPRSHQ